MARKALLVGIDDYPGLSNDLDSCINDVSAWRTLLMEQYRFKREEIRLAVNGRATKPAVLARLDWLLRGAAAGDSLVFVYSGHGTTFTRRDAADNLDEAKDQALCLAGPLDPASFLVDDELAGLFAGVPQGVNLTVICDSCFSGGMEKGLLPLPGEGRSVKYLPLPVDLAHRDDPFAPVRSFGCGQPSKAAAQPAPCLLLAACREIEPAAAARPETRGLSVFSYFAIRTLRSSTASCTATDLVSSVAQQIYNCGYPQVPQLKGPAAACQQPLFG